jgi:hypothetical protein
MAEYCLCGIPEDDHIPLEFGVEQTIDEFFNNKARIQAYMSNMISLYGNVCTNYKRDNLRYLEDKANE